MNISEIKINENALCTLRFAADSKLLIVDYLPLEKNILEDKFSLFYKKYESPIYSITDVLEASELEDYYIQTSIPEHKVCILTMSYYLYCVSFGGSWAELKALNMETYKMQDEHCKNMTNEALQKKQIIELKVKLLDELKLRLTAYLLEKTYPKAQQDISKELIVAYSHRKTGWETVNFKAGNDFSFKFATNFGYGSSSYFFLLMTYKGIEIIPYSEWITYRFAGFAENIHYSEEFYVDNSLG